MSRYTFQRKSLTQSIAEAFALKKQGKYVAAISLLQPYADALPEHKELQALYRKIEHLQQKQNDFKTPLFNL